MHKHSRYRLNYPAGWTLWERWVLVTAIGELIGMGIVAAAIAVTKLTATANVLVVLHIVGFLEGAVLGFAQWLVLRRYVRHSSAWIIATAVAALIAWLIGTKASIVLVLAYFHEINGEETTALLQGVGLLGAWVGAVLGFAQWLVLEVRIRGAAWWIVANAVAWSMGLLVAFMGAGLVKTEELTLETVLTGAVTGAMMGAVIGGVTGIALVWLLQPRLQQRDK